MKKFEYFVYQTDLYKQKDGSFEKFKPRAILEQFGKDGWELVSTECFEEHVESIGVDPELVINEKGEADYVDTGERCIWKRDIQKILLFFKREVEE